MPAPDLLEPNDEALWAARLYGARGRTLHATLDYWDDLLDVYAIRLAKGQRLFAHVDAARAVQSELSLWVPKTRKILGIDAAIKNRPAVSRRVGAQERLAYRAGEKGWYLLAVKLQSQTTAPYTLSYVKR